MKLHKKVFVKRGAHSTSLDQCVNLFLKVFIKKLKLSKKSFKLRHLQGFSKRPFVVEEAHSTHLRFFVNASFK